MIHTVHHLVSLILDEPLDDDDDLPRDPPPPLRPGAGLARAPPPLPSSRTTARRTKATISPRNNTPLCFRFISSDCLSLIETVDATAEVVLTTEQCDKILFPVHLGRFQ